MSSGREYRALWVCLWYKNPLTVRSESSICRKNIKIHTKNWRRSSAGDRFNGNKKKRSATTWQLSSWFSFISCRISRVFLSDWPTRTKCIFDIKISETESSKPLYGSVFAFFSFSFLIVSHTYFWIRFLQRSYLFHSKKNYHIMYSFGKSTNDDLQNCHQEKYCLEERQLSNST